MCSEEIKIQELKFILNKKIRILFSKELDYKK